MAHPLHSRSVKDMCTVAEAVNILIRFKAMKRKKKVAGLIFRGDLSGLKGIQSGLKFKATKRWS